MTPECVHFAPLIGSRPGELPAEEERALAAHVAGCETCRAIAADFAALDGLVDDGLMREAAKRDFAPFVDQVMARVAVTKREPEPTEAKPAWVGARFVAWVSRHRRATAGVLVPVLAAVAVLVYVRAGSGSQDATFLELNSEGEVATVLETSDGPVVLLADEDSGS
jgi:anti-sigma factor RsiW